MKQIHPTALFGNIDIYLFDQILKGRYQPQQKILDAGCGSGRNMFWFYHNDFELSAVDRSIERVEEVQERYPKFRDAYQVANLTSLPFEARTFDHVINSAVLHFAENTPQFLKMFSELVRVLRPTGSLFIRMASNVGIENAVKEIGDGVFEIPDGSIRFLLNRELLRKLLIDFPVKLVEPFKTTNVSDIRAMSTLVLVKEN